MLLAECSIDAAAEGSALRKAIDAEAAGWRDAIVDAFTLDYVLEK
jgi:hypothetical protein